MWPGFCAQLVSRIPRHPFDPRHRLSAKLSRATRPGPRHPNRRVLLTQAQPASPTPLSTPDVFALARHLPIGSAHRGGASLGAAMIRAVLASTEPSLLRRWASSFEPPAKPLPRWPAGGSISWHSTPPAGTVSPDNCALRCGAQFAVHTARNFLPPVHRLRQRWQQTSPAYLSQLSAVHARQFDAVSGHRSLLDTGKLSPAPTVVLHGPRTRWCARNGLAPGGHPGRAIRRVRRDGTIFQHRLWRPIIETLPRTSP